jgi:hypothetical protein
MIDRCGNSMAAMFWTGDNEDASNAISGTEYSMSLSLK